MQKIYILVSLILFTSVTVANPPEKYNLILEISSGVNAGWWIFNKGFLENQLGQDHTSLALFIPAQINILYKIDHLKIGTGLNYSFMFKTDMKKSSHSDTELSLYPIANKTVVLKKLALISEYDIYSSENYTMSPHLKFGWFDINTIHPDQLNFQDKIFWEFGITNQIKLESLSIIIRPVYNYANIKSHVNNIKNREHNFYNIGILIGMRYSIF